MSTSGASAACGSVTAATVVALVGVVVLVIGLAVVYMRALDRSESLLAQLAALRAELDAARRDTHR